uniref:Ig-like domain-containing protein n=1 Tax=Oryzias latipes TaxID=8090 RepID=A0A3B3IFK8_ORYLA
MKQKVNFSVTFFLNKVPAQNVQPLVPIDSFSMFEALGVSNSRPPAGFPEILPYLLPMTWIRWRSFNGRLVGKHVGYRPSKHFSLYFLCAERPSVSFLQKTPSSPVCCHATGFYPDRADLFWRKDGEEIHEGVEKGQILPNHDGTFQMSSELNVSLIKHEDWRRYDCVFQLSGLTEDIFDPCFYSVSPSEFPVGPVVGGAAGVVLLLVISGVLYCCWRNRNGEKQ